MKQLGHRIVQSLSNSPESNMAIKSLNVITLVFLFAFAVYGQTTGDGKRQTSLDGLYAVTFPNVADVGGGGPLETEFTAGLGYGYSTYWNGSGVYFQAGHVDFHKRGTAISRSEKDKLFAEAVARLKRTRTDGGLTLIGERAIKIRNIGVTELSFRGPNGQYIYRLFATEKGIVRFTTIFSSDQEKPLAMKFLESIESPRREAIVAEKVKTATPDSLPQCEAGFQMLDDITELGLSGKVESILEEREEIRDAKAVKWIDKEFYFNREGRILKEVDNDSDRPDTIEVFGCIDGLRVSKFGHASYENRFFGLGPGPRSDKPRDPRYSNAYEFKLDNVGRIAQKLVYGNNSLVVSTSTYIYGDDNVAITVVDAQGGIDRNILRTFDAKKRLVSSVDTLFGETAQWRRTCKVDLFDLQGNWIKRSCTSDTIKNSKVESSLKYIEYRKVNYYK